MRNKVSAIILNTARRNLLLSLTILVTAVGAIGAALVPPLILGRIVDALVNGQAVGRASGYVPETLHNIRTIHSLGKENYMEQRYDQAIGESYRAIERTNFYDAVYSPVVLTLNAVVAVVMLLSASGSPAVLTLFGMSAGTAVTVINYISQIFSPVESLGMEIQTIQSHRGRRPPHPGVSGTGRTSPTVCRPGEEPPGSFCGAAGRDLRL